MPMPNGEIKIVTPNEGDQWAITLTHPGPVLGWDWNANVWRILGANRLTTATAQASTGVTDPNNPRAAEVAARALLNANGTL